MPMMAITTNSSTSVKAVRNLTLSCMVNRVCGEHGQKRLGVQRYIVPILTAGGQIDRQRPIGAQFFCRPAVRAGLWFWLVAIGQLVAFRDDAFNDHFVRTGRGA